MNVTSLIKEKKFRKNLSKIINYPKKNKVKNKMSYFAGPKNFFLIGHAYEILFQIEYLRKRKSKEINNIKAFRKYGLLFSFKNKVSDKDLKQIEYLLKTLNKIEKHIYSYIFSQKKLNYKYIILLASISNIRTLNDIYKINKIKKSDKKDLKELQFSMKKFKKILKKELEFNTNVNYYSLIGEIDIKEKKCIYDIKTTMSNYISKDMINQLVIYYILSQNKMYTPKKIGIILSRYGKVKEFKIKKIISKKNQEKLKKLISEKIY